MGEELMRVDPDAVPPEPEREPAPLAGHWDPAPDLTRVDVPMILNRPGHGLGQWCDMANATLRMGNDPPSIFSRSGDHLVHVANGAIRNLNAAALRWYLSRVSNWQEVQYGPPTKLSPNGTRKIKNVVPPPEVLANILEDPEIDERAYPPLEAVVRAPTFAASGRLIDRPGYDAESRLFYAEPVGGLRLPPVPEAPSRRLVAAAVAGIEKLFADVAFATPAARATAFAALILPTARRLVSGNTPLHLITSPVPESGKSTLAFLMGVPILGEPTPAKAEVATEREFQNYVTSSLSEGKPAFLFDNLVAPIEGSSWSMALTARTWEDRPFHRNDRTVKYPNRTLWLATANNPTIAPDMLQRTVLIPLDTGTENPGDREYSRPTIVEWATDRRAALLWSILVLIRNWIARGRPQGKVRHNRYPVWGWVMGGILEAAGIEGFLATATRDLDPEAQRWLRLVEAWLGRFGTARVEIGAAFELVDRDPTLSMLFSPVLMGGQFPERLSRFREALIGLGRRIAGGHRVVPEPDGLHFRLEAAEPAPPTPGPDPGPSDPPTAEPESVSGAESAPAGDPWPKGVPGRRYRAIEDAARADAARVYGMILADLGPEETVRLADYLVLVTRRERPAKTPGEQYARSLRRELFGLHVYGPVSSRADDYMIQFASHIGSWAENGWSPGNHDFWPEPNPGNEDDPQEIRDREADYERHGADDPQEPADRDWYSA